MRVREVREILLTVMRSQAHQADHDKDVGDPLVVAMGDLTVWDRFFRQGSISKDSQVFIIPILKEDSHTKIILL